VGRLPVLWVLDPSVNTPEEQGVAEVLRDWPGTSRVFRPSLRPGDLPRDHAADGAVVLGSSASVHDASPWIAEVAEWLRPVVSGAIEMPVLGVCFGHQLLAHVAGAPVGYLRPDRSKTTGVETTRVAGSRLLPGEHELRAIVSHRECVEQVPEGFRVVATRPGSALDGLEHARLPLYSFQFHPEAREEFATRAGIGAAAVDDRLRRDGRRLLGAFCAAVAARRASDP
jgi:GMP synthase (glutamine-hydrolysing)